MLLNRLKLLLGINGAGENDLDELLLLIVDMVTARLKAFLGGADPPKSLEYIIIEVSVVRFNRIRSEGLKTHTIEGETLDFESSNDFDPYMKDIQAFLDSQTEITAGKLRFI